MEIRYWVLGEKGERLYGVDWDVLYVVRGENFVIW